MAAEVQPSEPLNQALADRQRSDLGNRLAVNVLSNYASLAVNLVVGLYLTRFLVHRLGDEMFGAWVLIGSVMMYLGLVDLGFGSSIQKFMAEFAARGEEARIGRLLSTAGLVFAGLGFLLFLLSAAACPLIGTVFRLSPANVAEARMALVLMGVVQGLALPLGVFNGALVGLQRMDVNNLVSVAGTAVIVLCVVSFVNMGWGLLGICSAYLIVTVVAGLAKYLVVKRLLPNLRLSLSGYDRGLVRTTSTYGFTFFGLKIAHFLKYHTDSFVIAGFLSTAAVTPFAVANRLATMIRQIVEQAVEVLVPVFSQLNSFDDTERMRLVYVQAGKVTMGIAAPITLFVCAFARPILQAWLVDVPRQADLLTVILAITVFASVVPAVSVKLMLGVAKHRTLAIITLLDSIANLILSMLLVRPYGLVGVAVGTMIPLVITHVFIFPWLGCRLIRMPTAAFLGELARASLLPAVPAGVVVWALLRYTQTANAAVLLLGAAAVGAVYLLFFGLWSLDASEREIYVSRMRRLRSARG